MSKLYEEIEKYCDKLQHEAELKKLIDTKISEAECDGYKKGCEDMLRFIRQELKNSKRESEVVPNAETVNH